MTGALPPAFVERLERIVPGDRLADVLESFSAPRAIAFRINTLCAREPDVLAAIGAHGLGTEPVAWCPGAHVLVQGTLRELQLTEAYRFGEIYVQGLASMAVPLVLDPQPGEDVLDLTAAPGSKTTQIAALMDGRGHLLANDRSRARSYRLKAQLEQAGAMFVELSRRAGEQLGRTHTEAFDRVLLDAPCSAESRMRADDPDTTEGWKMARIKRLAGQQRRLLDAAARCTRPGGVVVYSTCTFAPEENEAVVDHVLGAWEGRLELEPPSASLPVHAPGLTSWGRRRFDESLGRAVRLLPGAGVEGFFIARLRRA